MAFVNNKSNASTKINSSTKVTQIYNPVGTDASTLTMGFWNTYSTLKINPALHPSKREANKVYDYDVSASVVMNAEVTTTLYNAIHLVEEGKSVAVKAGQYMIKVGPCSDYEGMEGEYYLGLFEIDKNEIQIGGLFFVFNPGSSDDDVALVGWNENEGSVVEEVILNTQWEMFKNFLKLASETLVSGGSHGAFSQLNLANTKLVSAVDLLKSLVEMLVGGKSNSVAPDSRNSNNYGSGFASQRKPRSFNSSSTSPVRGSRRSLNEEDNTVSQSVGRRSRNKVQEEVISDVKDIERDLDFNISFDTEIDVDLDNM